jgi:peroxiredoxin Q/BCP
MVELRKRKASENGTEPVKKKAAALVEKVKAAVSGDKPATNGSAKKLTVGEVVSLEDFGGEIETEAGNKTTLKALIDESTAGVVLFTYPKASTPGCE